MAIYFSNNARYINVGRLYHAELIVPTHLDAIIRLCHKSNRA
jgi:hypothetical protein